MARHATQLLDVQRVFRLERAHVHRLGARNAFARRMDDADLFAVDHHSILDWSGELCAIVHVSDQNRGPVGIFEHFVDIHSGGHPLMLPHGAW